MIKIVQGGSTGLVQQKLKKYPPKKPKAGILKEIKDSLKSQYGCDLVLIQAGYTMNIIEEDAKYFEKEFNFKSHDRGGRAPYIICGFAKNSGLKKYQKLLDERKVCYCLVEQIDGGGGKPVTREVTFSSCNEKALGLIF